MQRLISVSKTISQPLVECSIGYLWVDKWTLHARGLSASIAAVTALGRLSMSSSSSSSPSSTSSSSLLLFCPVTVFPCVSDDTRHTGAKAPSLLLTDSASTVHEPSSLLFETLTSLLQVKTLLLSIACSMAGPKKNALLSDKRLATREIPIEVVAMANGLRPESSSLLLACSLPELFTMHFGVCCMHPLYSELVGIDWLPAVPSDISPSVGTDSSSETLKTRSEESDGGIMFATLTITWGPSMAATVPSSLFSLSRKTTSLTSQVSEPFVGLLELKAFLLTLVWGLEDRTTSLSLEINSSSTVLPLGELTDSVFEWSEPPGSLTGCTPLSIFPVRGSTLIFVTVVLLPSGDSWHMRRPTMGPLISQHLYTKAPGKPGKCWRSWTFSLMPMWLASLVALLNFCLKFCRSSAGNKPL